MEKTDKILTNKGKTSKTYVPVLMLLIASVAVYFPILGHDFLYRWDDRWMVINRYSVFLGYTTFIYGKQWKDSNSLKINLAKMESNQTDYVGTKIIY